MNSLPAEKKGLLEKVMPGPNTHNSRITSFLRIVTWICVLTLALLSLMPADYLPRTGFPGVLNHFIAYAGSCGIAIAAYRNDRLTSWKIIAPFCVYAAILEYLQGFVGRDPAVKDFVASSLGAACGGVATAVLWPRLLQLSTIDRWR